MQFIYTEIVVSKKTILKKSFCKQKCIVEKIFLLRLTMFYKLFFELSELLYLLQLEKSS